MDANSFEDFAREVRRLWAELAAARLRADPLPPAGEPAVAALERHLGVAFPADYRRFLCDVSAGGAWLYSVDDHLRGRTHKGLPGDPTRPFLHARAWNLSRAEFAAAPDEGADPDGYEAFWARYFRSELIDGTIPLSDGGCSSWYLLVVTGPERGCVWEDDRGVDSGLAPVSADGRHLRFPEFYLWLLRSFLPRRSPR